MVNIRFLLGTLALVGAPGAIAATIRQRDCSFSVPAEAGDTCQSLAASWAIGVDQFTRWNAGVQCGAALVAGKEYCVEWDGPEPVVTTTSSSTASKTTTTPKAPTLSTTSTTTSAAALPTDSMPDIVSNCNKFYKVASGDTCATIESINGITDADFKKWNPYITSTCTNLWLDYNVCVGVPGSTTSKPSTTTNAPAVPTDNMPDIVSNCNKFHKVASGDTCATIESANGITDADFKKWNPYITSTCTNLWLDYNVCVGVPGSTTSKPSMTTTAPAIPTDNMPDIVSNCNKFYKIVSGETCATIESSKGVTDADFKKWNPYINSACTNLWLGYNVCVGVPGSQPITTTKIMTTTTPSGPTPTQSGIVQDCQKYHQAVSGDTCQVIADKYRTFSVADFYKWNPAVGSSCSSLWVGYYYCIAVKETPTTPPPTTPTPVQVGITSKCNKWHLVASGDICQTIADKYKITTTNFYSWNPAVGKTCASLWLGYYVCVGSS